MEYKIHRWDMVTQNDVTKSPMIYIKPDPALLEFARKERHAMIAEIKGTGTHYDGKKVRGILARSADVPNCRPNFFAHTGLYVFTMDCFWQGYPPEGKLGVVTFSMINGGSKEPKPEPESPNKVTNTSHSPSSNSDSSNSSSSNFDSSSSNAKHHSKSSHSNATDKPRGKKVTTAMILSVTGIVLAIIAIIMLLYTAMRSN